MKTTLILRRIRFAALAAAGIATAVGLSPLLRAAAPGAVAPTTGPAVAAAPTTEPAQSAEALETDIDRQVDQIKDVLGNPSILTDAAKRSEVADRVLKPLQKAVEDCDALVKADPAHKDQFIPARAEYRIFQSLFGDSDATMVLATEANSTDADQALEGKRSLLMVSWLRAADDEDHQTKLADKLEALAKDNPKDLQLTAQIVWMHQLGCSTPELAQRLETVISDTMQNDLAEKYKKQFAAANKQQEEEAAAAKKLAELEDKPLVIAGKQPDGKDFTTADWKGKVILVDFWATWCGPCKEELPDVKEMYEKYHARGLEILGVSNDQSADDLIKFLKEDGAMPWPELLEFSKDPDSRFSPITQKFGISGIPTMFLIDRHGVVRTVSAADNMKDLIPKLLDEK